jgi:large subunit ribosomal protein L22
VFAQDLVATARLRYLGTSAQKVRLVVDLIRGRDVGEALATLRHTRKAVAPEIGRLLDSAVANAHVKRQDVDVDRLYVKEAFVDGGPSLKRIRPAPMGRAFRVLKRMCHVTIGLGERRSGSPDAHDKGSAVEGPSGRRAAAPRPRTPARARRPVAGKATAVKGPKGRTKKRGV